MTAAVAIGIGVLILAAMAYDIARLTRRQRAAAHPWHAFRVGARPWNTLSDGASACVCTTGLTRRPTSTG